MNAVTEKPRTLESAARTEISAPPNRGVVKRLVRPAIALVVVVAALVTAGWWFAEGRFIETTDNAYVQGDIAVLSPRIEGNVAAIMVGDNQAVRAGEPLIALDDADWQARLAQASATAAEATAAVSTADSQIRQQQAMIDVAGAAVVQAQAEQVRAAADAGRAASLVLTGAGSRQANDLAIADTRKADAVVRSARAQVVAAQQQLGVLQAQLVQADARRLNAQASLTLARNNLGYTVIRAPFDGVAGNRAAQLGEHVAAGTQLIAVAPLASRLYVASPTSRRPSSAACCPGRK